eukprot:TRINITY_DN43186_c0_g1_i1.p1 TRINITY_DN43186_c0_g1~~TRINITY_DN43186_c0_g1_i1.p1  ORF type:complete len:848 (+),score=143.11 TRINITY_DN43186_c0_g1_i1:93-2546(+)
MAGCGWFFGPCKTADLVDKDVSGDAPAAQMSVSEENGTSTRAGGSDKAAANQQTSAETLSFLAEVQLFKRLPKDQHGKLAEACTKVSFKAGEEVIRQGDPGAAFFVIVKGNVSVIVSVDGAEPSKVASLGVGNFFGENALLRDEPRTATIMADSDLSTLKITRDKFKELGLNDKLQFPNRKAIGGGGQKLKPLMNKTAIHKTPEIEKFIGESLRKNENLKVMANMDGDGVNKLVAVAWKEEVEAGVKIIEEGDINANHMYIVQDGSFEIFTSKDQAANPRSAEAAVRQGEINYVSTVTKGGSFGELALLYLVPRAATVQAKVKSTVWVIDRSDFKDILLKTGNEKVQEHVRFLNSVTLLDVLSAEEKEAMARGLLEMIFEKGSYVLQQGESGTTFYILCEGTIAYVQDGAEVERVTANTAEGLVHFFGEKALLNNEPRKASAKVVSQQAKMLVMDRDTFTMLLGPFAEILKTKEEGGISSGPEKSKAAKTPGTGERIHFDDLRNVGLLGCGGFGTVELWEHKQTKAAYAVKGLSKGYILQAGTQTSVIEERDILLALDSVFIIKLFETYNKPQFLYYLMELALGGELYATYNRKGFHGSLAHARFYSAGVVFAFSHIHSRKIIYRDLKPENLLLTETGAVKLTDMGLAKQVVGMTYTTCGTPDYFAPEMIESSGHSTAVDWWCLGILIFELMAGSPPFEANYPMQTYRKVMKGISAVPFPSTFDEAAIDLVKVLLKKQPAERLPMRPGGVQNFKDHSWYEDFDWCGMEDLSLEPPYKPNVTASNDLTNFTAAEEDMPPQIEYEDDGTGWDAEFATST